MSGTLRVVNGQDRAVNQLCVRLAELWLSKIERDLIARGIFISTTDLSRKLLRYIRQHNKTAKPIKWKYTDIRRRIRAPHSAVTGH